jgi:hypothetical protein
VRTPAWIKKKFRESSISIGNPPSLGVDYPFDYVQTRESLSTTWSALNGTEDVREESNGCFEKARNRAGQTKKQRGYNENAATPGSVEGTPKKRRTLADPLERALMAQQRK